MIQGVYGIKQFQTKLPQIAKKISIEGGHYLVTNRSQPSLVAIPFSDYQDIADILLELQSPTLKRDIRQGREEFRKGKTIEFRQFLKQQR